MEKLEKATAGPCRGSSAEQSPGEPGGSGTYCLPHLISSAESPGARRQNCAGALGRARQIWESEVCCAANGALTEVPNPFCCQHPLRCQAFPCPTPLHYTSRPCCHEAQILCLRSPEMLDQWAEAADSPLGLSFSWEEGGSMGWRLGRGFEERKQVGCGESPPHLRCGRLSKALCLSGRPLNDHALQLNRRCDLRHAN